MPSTEGTVGELTVYTVPGVVRIETNEYIYPVTADGARELSRLLKLAADEIDPPRSV